MTTRRWLSMSPTRGEQFAQAEAAGVEDLEAEAWRPGGRGREQADDLLGGEDVGQGAGPFAVGDEGDLVGAAEGDAVEEAQGTGGLIEAAPGGLLSEEVKEVNADVSGAELVGGAVEVASELSDLAAGGCD